MLLRLWACDRPLGVGFEVSHASIAHTPNASYFHWGVTDTTSKYTRRRRIAVWFQSFAIRGPAADCAAVIRHLASGVSAVLTIIPSNMKPRCPFQGLFGSVFTSSFLPTMHVMAEKTSPVAALWSGSTRRSLMNMHPVLERDGGRSSEPRLHGRNELGSASAREKLTARSVPNRSGPARHSSTLSVHGSRLPQTKYP